MDNRVIKNKLFVILIGESGVGKSSVMKRIQQVDQRFTILKLTTDRPPRIHEKEDRECISEVAFSILKKKNKLLPIITKHGNKYAVRRVSLQEAFDADKIPIVDYTFEDLSNLTEFQDVLFPMYIMPPHLDILKKRLKKLGRDPDGKRFQTAKTEIEAMQANNFYPKIITGGVVVNKNLEETVQIILNKISTQISKRTQS